MARGRDAYSKFDKVIETAAVDYSGNPWTAQGLDLDLGLLDALIKKALERGSAQNTGDFARAFDCWAAVELRRLGFPPDEVWPRDRMPRVLPREVALLTELVTKGGSAKASRDLRAHLNEWLETHDRSPRIAPTEAKVLGGVYEKQADVLIAHWSTGIELMISTKSMLGSYGKNLRNRFEESFGDAINLRQRFPLGSFGFLFAIDTKVPQNDFVFLVNMLTKLVDAAGYDATCLILVDLEAQRVESSSTLHEIPGHLTRESFFAALVEKTIERTPASRHLEVRRRYGLEIDAGEGDLES